MSAHSDLFQSASLPLLFELHADSGRVTYIPAGGSAVSLSAIVGNERSRDENDPTGKQRVLERTITITTDSDGTYGGVADPKTNAVVTVDDLKYAVESLKPVASGYVDLVVVRHEAIAQRRPDYNKPGYRMRP